ncbi:MAG: hypothetical protein KAJ97_07070 [Acidobacteria bacterium]|nr:hypothetical protein [Acidobacteriota bacterium]
MLTKGSAVRVEAPCRADLAGGTLDIWPLGLLHAGALTVNAAVPVTVRMEVDLEGPKGEVWHAVGEGEWRRLSTADAATDLSAAVGFGLRPAGGARVRVLSQAPVGSGLGGSSAYAVALARGLLAATGEKMEETRLVAVLRDLEATVLSTPTGVQDHWAAVRGGALALHMEPGTPRVERLAVDPDWLGERMTVFFTGITHHSGMVNWQVIRRRLEGDGRTAVALDGIAAAAASCRTALLEADEAGVAGAVGAEWAARKRLAPEVCPSELEDLELVALNAGALAVKACGAGGGGSLLLWHPPREQESLAAALQAAAPAGRVLATGIATEGCKVFLAGDSDASGKAGGQ